MKRLAVIVLLLFLGCSSVPLRAPMMVLTCGPEAIAVAMQWQRETGDQVRYEIGPSAWSDDWHMGVAVLREGEWWPLVRSRGFDGVSLIAVGDQWERDFKPVKFVYNFDRAVEIARRGKIRE